jgi:ribosomal protein S18 acetylase RimI-like enzyme
MDVQIREARPEEYDETGAVTARAYQEFFVETEQHPYLDEIADVAGRAPRTTILVAVDGDRIIGSATLELDGRTSDEIGPLAPDEAHVRMLGVHPDARGAGVGKQLLAACEERARQAGRTRMTLNTTTLMRAARAMYTSLGYERSEDRVLPDGFVLLGYTKQLVRSVPERRG